MQTAVTTTKTGDASLQIAAESDALVRLAIDKNLDVDKLERIIALHNEAKAHAAKAAFFEAFKRLQSELPEIVKRRNVSQRGGGLLYKFANLTDIVRVLRPLEQAHGFAHRFEFSEEGGRLCVTCIVTHKGGHEERTSMVIPATKGQNTSAAQDAGGEATYGMRYTLLGALGITTGMEDNDARAEPEQAVSIDQLDRLQYLCGKTRTDEGKVCAYAGVKTLAELPASRFKEIETMLAKKPGAA
jgi:hypothetical protein